jgi:uncharacterized membrane protein
MTYEPLIHTTLAIQVHTVAAILAFLLGGIVLFRRKGDRLHRFGGRLWVGLMLAVAATSFFIHAIGLVGIWSPIHLISVATFWLLARGVWLARAGRIADHRAMMQQTYLGALVVAGAFTFWPGRIMHAVFFEGPHPWMGVAAAAVLVAGIAFLMRRMVLEGRSRRRAAPAT